MKPYLLALPVMLALVAACGERRVEGDAARAAAEDTTAAPSTDLGTPSKDTAADTGSSEVRMRRHDGPMVPGKSDTSGRRR
ncbi:MAG TPA: hypothetical protein VFR62_14585 [Gemmatimonadales bacterium]|nr:hypothetical protein [Gemmatimonadales bacterium]